MRLSRTKWPRLVKRIWEPSLPVPVPVQVVERGRVGNVLVVDDEEVAGGVLAVGAAVDGPGPVQGADNEGGVDVAFDVVTPAMEPVVWMVRL